jgi:hypothetical protein
MVSALQYIEETILCAEILKLMPRALTPYGIPESIRSGLTDLTDIFKSAIGAIIQRCLSSHKAIYEVLLPIADQRCLERDLGKVGGEVPKHVHCTISYGFVRD